MFRPKQFIRFLEINIILARHRVDCAVLSYAQLGWLRALVYLNPWNWWRSRQFKRGEAIRISLEELGPIFVKFGQMLSTRRDLLPEDIANELAKLQDQVPPFPGEKAQAMIEKAYHQPVSKVFKIFDVKPLASASVAQVHAATLHDGTEVIIKVLRPGIRRQIMRDIQLMYTVARLIQRIWSGAKRFKLVEIVSEFEQTICDELDMQREAANASQLRRNFLHSTLTYVPEIYWPYVKKNILVIERIYGIRIDDIETLKRHGVNLKVLAEKGVEIFFTQVFRDSFFHADMHAGNIFVDISNPEDPIYMGVDFGIMGSLSSFDQRYIAENLLAFFKRDYRRIATLHVQCGWVDPKTRVENFEAAIRTVCEPIFEKSLGEISFGQLLIKLFQTARQFNMEVQPQLLLLQKTLFNIEGLGRILYPELDLWATAKPFLERWIRTKIGPKALLKQIIRNAPMWIERSLEIPDLLYQVLYEIVKSRPTKTKNAVN